MNGQNEILIFCTYKPYGVVNQESSDENIKTLIIFQKEKLSYVLFKNQKIMNVNVEGYNFFPNKSQLVGMDDAREIWNVLCERGWEYSI